MANLTTPQQPTLFRPATEVELELEQIQGDVLLGLQKNFEKFVFFKINDPAGFKAILAEQLIPQVTSSLLAMTRELQLRDRKTEAIEDTLADEQEPFSLVGLNIGFTQSGINKLVPNSNLGDSSFAAGAQQQAGSLNDPLNPAGKPSTWLPEFVDSGIDGVVLITGGTKAVVDDKFGDVQTAMGTAAAIIYTDTGNTRPKPYRGHEHFGWLDGVSQPGIKGLTNPFPGQDMLEPGLFVFGYPTGQTSIPSLPTPWMKNGSFMVFRRLKQLVPEFNQFLSTSNIRDESGNQIEVDPTLLGARMVGRWKSGAPIALNPIQDDSTLGGDPKRNNNFDFSDDKGQRRCPFSAHIRKTNPRNDLPSDAVNIRRIIRAGIPYGPEVTPEEALAKTSQQDRGLMFVCYQTSIAQQFEFLQSDWANNPGFFPSTPSTGIDPIIGQGNPGQALTSNEPISNYPTGSTRSTLTLPQSFVVPTGGGYFFMPSISALTTVFAA